MNKFGLMMIILLGSLWMEWITPAMTILLYSGYVAIHYKDMRKDWSIDE